MDARKKVEQLLPNTSASKEEKAAALRLLMKLLQGEQTRKNAIRDYEAQIAGIREILKMLQNNSRMNHIRQAILGQYFKGSKASKDPLEQKAQFNQTIKDTNKPTEEQVQDISDDANSGCFLSLTSNAFGGFLESHFCLAHIMVE